MSDEYSIHYCSYNSLIVVNPAGKLKQLYTPFRVSSKVKKGKKSQWYVVDEIISGDDGSLYFYISGKVYFHSQFSIDIQF